MKVFEAISDALKAEGVSIAFSLMGDATQNLIVDLGERNKINVIHCRHEQNVVAIADGFTRFSAGELGLALVTTGPGLTNTATSLAAAKAHRSPVLVLAGAPSIGDLHSPQEIDQTAFSRLLAGAGATLDTAASLDTQLDRALGHVRRSGPFVLNLPGNVQNAELASGWTYNPRYCKALPTLPTSDELANAAHLLVNADRIAIVAGRGAVLSGAEGIISQLATHLQAPIGTTLPAKGLCSGHPLWVGVSGGLGEGVAPPIVSECDVLLAVGAGLNQWTTHSGDLVKNAKIVQIDTEEKRFGAFCRADNPLLGDARFSLEALYEHIRRMAPLPRPPDERLKVAVARGWEAHRAPIHYETASDGTIDPRLAIRELDRLLPQKRLVVAAGGHAGYLVCQLLHVASPADWNYTIDFGALGQGLGTAIGAAFARRGQRVYHLTGDGEFMMSLSDFHTAVLYNLPITVAILNDQGFGQERHDLEHKHLPFEYAMQPSPDFARLAAGFGALGFRFDTPESLSTLEGALAKADDFKGPTILDFRINGAYESPVSQEIAKALA